MQVVPKIRLATDADVLEIAHMSRDYIEQGLGWSWTAQRVGAALRDAATNVALIEDHGRVSAFGIMMYGDERAHLSLLAVRPQQRHQGRATRLLAWLELSAATAGIGSIRVEARADNAGALAFYQRLGYAPLQRVCGYYRGSLDAVRLQKNLWQPHTDSA